MLLDVTGYFKLYLDISNFRGLVAFILFLFCFLLLFFLELENTEGWFFKRVYLYICDIAGHELSTLSIRVHNSLKVHGNSWALKFDNYSES